MGLNKMTGKQWLVLVVVLCVLAAMVAIQVVEREGNLNSSQASLSEPTMAKSVNETTAEVTEPADVFTPDTPVIYCSVKLSNAPADTEVKAQWIYIKGEAKGMTNRLLYETSATFHGTRYLSFSLTYDTEWPKGEYKVVLYVDGKEQLSVPFKVQ